MTAAAASALRSIDGANDLTRLGLASLMTLAFEGVPLTPIATHLIEQASSDPDDADALMHLSVVLQLHGLKAEGLAVQACALRMQRLYRQPAARQPALKLLALMAPGDLMTNTPVEFLIERSDVALSTLYLPPDEPLPEALPAHDVLFVAVSESDATRPLLDRMALQLPRWGGRVVNHPEHIVQTSRSLAHLRLQGAPGIVMPCSVRLARATLERLARRELKLPDVLPDGEFPVIVRPVDSHAGHGLVKCDSTPMLQAYLATAGADGFFISRFIDYRSADGMYRKYRVVLVDGVPYPAHMGVSSHWMIHYLNAGMTDSPAKRAEEQTFMTGFDIGFGRRHAAALYAVAERFALEYVVIDCAESADGDLLVFELDPGAVIHAMDPPDVFPYKRPQMERIFRAFRDLLGRHAAPTASASWGGDAAASLEHQPTAAAS